MHKSGTQDRCILVLTLTGIANKNEQYRKQQVDSNCCTCVYSQIYTRIHVLCCSKHSIGRQITTHCCKGRICTNFNTNPHWTHYKAFYSSEAQADSYHAARGNGQPLSPHLDLKTCQFIGTIAFVTQSRALLVSRLATWHYSEILAVYEDNS